MRFIFAAMLAVSAAVAQQTPPNPAQRTREFLGLGPAPDPAAAERGTKTYTANCSFCHGLKASGGDSGPDLIRSSLVLHDQRGETIGPVVHNGRPDRGMPAFPSLSDAEIRDIAEFLHMRIELTANRGTYQVLNVVTGDANAGKAYFNGPGQCYHCHSVNGDLAHIGANLSPADLQQTFLYPESRMKGKAPVAAAVRLASSESISGTLKYLDDFVVIVVDPDGTSHTINRAAGVTVHVEDPLRRHRELLDHYTDAEMHNLTAYLATLK